MTPTWMASVAGLNTAILLNELHSSYNKGNHQLYPLLGSMYNKSCVRTLVAVQLVLLANLAFSGIIRLLFGRLSRIESDYLGEQRWPVFVELASSYVLFQSTLGVVGFMHFLAMYFLMMGTLLLAKRIEEMCSFERDEHANQPDLTDHTPPGNHNLAHMRITLLIAMLYLINCYAIRYQMKHLKLPSGHFSMLTSVTLHRYVVTTATLVKAIANYLLNLTEARYYAFDWENKIVLESVVTMLSTGLEAVSNSAIVALVITNHVRAISLFRLAIRSIKRFMLAVKNLVSAYCAVERMESFGMATQEEASLAGMCPICLIPIGGNANEDNRKVPSCGHIFHYRCLKRWARTRQTCPTCRAEL